MFDDGDDHNPYGTSGSDPYDYDYQPFSKKAGASEDTSYSPPTTAMDEESIRMKVQELARREAELDEREREIRERELEGGAVDGTDDGSGGSRRPKPNFPLCYPIVYHSIWAIKDNHRRITCLLGFISWIALSIISVLNFINAIVTLFSSGPDEMMATEKVQYVLFAAILAVLVLPVHFIVSYWPLYKAMQTVSIGRFIIFFIAYLPPILFCAFGVSGWYPYGVSGIITAIACLPPALNGRGTVHGFVMNIVMALLWLVAGIMFLIIYVNVIVAFRRRKHTMQNVKDYAKEQVSRGVSSAVSTAVRAGSSAI